MANEDDDVMLEDEIPTFFGGADLSEYRIREDHVSFPPIIRGHTHQGQRNHDSVSLSYLDAILGNLGSISYILGSVFLFPEIDEKHKYRDTAAEFYIFGCVCYIICNIFTTHAVLSMPDWDPVILGNALVFLFANTIFLVGSILFLPDLSEYLTLGTTLFVIGSFLFIVAPAYNWYRSSQMRAEGLISKAEFQRERRLAFCFIVGSVIFFFGSLVYYPFRYVRC